MPWTGSSSFVRPTRGGLLAPWGMEVLPIDMVEKDDEVLVITSVPGVKPEDIDISVTGDTLTIKGETKMEEEVKKENLIRQERRYGAFSRSVALPTGLDTDKAEATFKDGVLTLRFPKREEVRPKTIKVKAASKKK